MPHGHVALITITRPEAMNALDFAANDELLADGPERVQQAGEPAVALQPVPPGTGPEGPCPGGLTQAVRG